MKNNIMQEFIHRISAGGEMNVEYCRDCSSQKKKHSYQEIIEKYYDKKNLFFSTGIKDITKNRSKSNISKINRITIDIDFRKQYKAEYGIDITDDEIVRIGYDIGKLLRTDYPNDYGQWSFIVFSGNGIHIHYIGDVYEINSEKDFDLYREATLHFYHGFNQIMGSKEYFADEKVGDLGHLFRLPGTINEKEGVKHRCSIISFQDVKSEVVSKMPLLLRLADKRIKKRQEEFMIKMKQKQAAKAKEKKYSNGIDVFEWINKNVDVADVIQILIPERKLKSDKKNFCNPAKPGNVNASYFIDRQNNILIRNGSTKLPGNKEGFNPVSLVIEWFGFGGRDCIEWFVNNGLVSKDILNNNK